MDYKAYALMAILLASVASVALVGAAYAQSTITVQTDKPSYVTGDEITITGKLTTTTINQPLLIQVKDPEGNFDKIDPFEAAADGSFSYKFIAGGTMNTDGKYTVIISYKGTTTEETTFQFDAKESEWKTFTIRVGDKSYPVQYQITGGSVTNMVPDENTSTLTVTITSTADGTLLIRLPRNVIDSRMQADANGDMRAGADDDFVVFEDDVPSDNVGQVNQTESTADRRTLSIGFDQGTETIDIVGTWAIPEFGAIAAIILAIAIVGIIVATTRYGKFNFAPRL